MNARMDGGSSSVRPSSRLARACVAAALGLVACGGVVLDAGIARAADAPRGDAPISDEARARFNAGVNLLMDPEGPRYEEAYREFKAAYAVSPSYKILGNLGLCAMKLERDDEAIAAYTKYLAEAKGIPPAEANQVRNDLATLKAGVAHVTVESVPPGARIIDTRVGVRGDRLLNEYGAATAPLRIALREGTHQITARLDGYVEQTWDVDLAGGQDLPDHKFELTPVAAPEPAAPPPVAAAPPPPTPEPLAPVHPARRPVPVAVWAGVAVTGALVVATGIVGGLYLKDRSDYDQKNDAFDRTDAQSLRSKGQTLGYIADGCLGGAVVAAAATVVLYFVHPGVAAGPAMGKDKEDTGFRLAPVVARGGGGLSLFRSF